MVTSLQTVLTALADAIRSKSGRSGTMTMEQMTEAVSGIQLGDDTSDATATAEDIVNGKTAYVNGQKVTGNIPLKTSLTWTGLTPIWENGTLRLAGSTNKQFIEKDSRVNMYCDSSKLGDATAEDVAAGKTFTSTAGLKAVGTRTEPVISLANNVLSIK